MTADLTTRFDVQAGPLPLIAQGSDYDYRINGRPVENQDRAVLLLGQALERIDPAVLPVTSSGSAIVFDPRNPESGPLTVHEFAARLEEEFGLAPGDWPGTITPYTAITTSSVDFAAVNALLQSLGDHLAEGDERIPFEFVRPDSYLVLGDETAFDIAHRFGVDAQALTSEAEGVIGSGSIVDLSSDALDSAPLTSAERLERTRELINDLQGRLTTLEERLGSTGYAPSYATDVWGDADEATRSFEDYLDQVLNPALEGITGKTLEESVLPYGLGSLYSAQGDFTRDSVASLRGAIERFESAELQVRNGETDAADSPTEPVTAVVGNITRGENGAFFVDGEQRSVLRIAAEIRLGTIDDEAARAAELLQSLNARTEKSALGAEILDVLSTLETSDSGDFVPQSSLWARGDNSAGANTAFAAGLRALAEKYGVDDPFAEFLPNHSQADARVYSHDDLVDLQQAIGAFRDTATRDRERDNLAIQESHSKLNVLLENLNAIIQLISKVSEIARNIG